MAKPTGSPSPDPATPMDPTSRPALAEHFVRGCKPKSKWASGAEVELFVYDRATLERIGPETVEAILTNFEGEGARLVRENGHPIEAWADWGAVTVEPGGQIELSATHRRNLAEVERDTRQFLEVLGRAADRLGLLVVACGFDPLRGEDEQQWFPKRRYAILRPYLATRGRRGADMMCRTASIQANIDYGSLEDLARKFIVGNRLGPIVAAMFAASPFENGKLSGYKSTRIAAWLDTDPDRSGVSPAALGDFTVEKFVDYALGVPMLFVRRDGGYIDLAGTSFENFLKADWRVSGRSTATGRTISRRSSPTRASNSTSSFEARTPEGRLGAALQAFWKGLTYDTAILQAALDIAPRLDRSRFASLQADVAKHALESRSEGVDVLALAREVVQLAKVGLARVAPDESRYLDPLVESVVVEGICPADRIIRDFDGAWARSVARAIEALRVA